MTDTSGEDDYSDEDCEINAQEAAELVQSFVTRNRERISQSNQQEFLARSSSYPADDQESCSRTNARRVTHTIQTKSALVMPLSSNPLAKTVSKVHETHVKKWTLCGLPESMVTRVDTIWTYLGNQIDRRTLADVTLLERIQFCHLRLKEIEDACLGWKSEGLQSTTSRRMTRTQRQFDALSGIDRIKTLEERIIALEENAPEYTALVFHPSEYDGRVLSPPITIWTRSGGGKWSNRLEESIDQTTSR